MHEKFASVSKQYQIARNQLTGFRVRRSISIDLDLITSSYLNIWLLTKMKRNVITLQ